MRAITSKITPLFNRLPTRHRQFATLAALAGAAVGILWLVFSLTGSKPAATPSVPGAPGDAKPTNVGLMAPGAQVDPVDQWVGNAGKKLAQYESDRGEQLRKNREREEFEQKTLARFADMEKKLTAAQAAASAPTVTAPAAPQPPAATATPPARYPPDAALATAGLPPPPSPTGRGGLPPGAPGPMGTTSAFQPEGQATFMRVSVGDPSKSNPVKETAGSAGGSGASAGPQTLDNFLPVSFTRGQLLGGLDAPTGGQAQSNPHPVLIRLSDNTILPNRYRAEYRECFVIASGYGDIGSERAYMRTVSLSCVRRDGTALEVRIEGGVYGEDGKYGVRGRLVTKQGQMLANALLAGVVSGIGQGLATSNTSVSTSALGQIATTTGSDAYKAGIGTGVGKALDRLAQYYIKLAEQTFPVIEIDAAREVDVVITKGVRIDAPELAKASSMGTSQRARQSNRFLNVDANEEADDE